MLELIRNADVFSPEPLGLCQILVAGESIAWVGREDPVLPSELGVRILDLKGARVIPGLVDGHAHITGGGGEAGEHTRILPLPAQSIVEAGITTIVGLLGTDDETRPTASLIATARGLRQQGLSAYCYTGGYHIPPTTLTGSVRRDIVFVDVIVGVGEIAISDHRSSQPSLDELLRVASEAHVGGMLSNKAGIAHLHLGSGKNGLALVREAMARSELPPRVFYPTHVNRRRALFEEALDLAARGCFIDVTAYPTDPSRPEAPTTKAIAGGKEEPLTAERAILEYLAAGLPSDRLTVSSDAGGSLPRFDADGRMTGMEVGQPAALSDCLRHLLEEGHSLRRILPAFTTNPARAILLHRKGQVATGADADLVVLDATHRVSSVMARGRWLLWEGRYQPAAELPEIRTRAGSK